MRFDLLGIAAAAALSLVAVAVVTVVYHKQQSPAVVAVTAPQAVPVAPPRPPAPVVAPAPPAPAVPDLPTVVVATRPVHEVPEDAPPPPPRPIALQTSGGKAIEQPRQAVPAAAPATVRAPAPALNGPATAASATSLAIDGRTVRLFGVRPAEPGDRCGTPDGSNELCANAARTALARLLAGKGAVSCHMPAGQRGDPAFVCRDGTGTDLGGFLVAEGFARADTKESYDYFGAEGVARSFHRGLWRYR
jgi:endonuclease YncB( thermonuclease family)